MIVCTRPEMTDSAINFFLVGKKRSLKRVTGKLEGGLKKTCFNVDENEGDVAVKVRTACRVTISSSSCFCSAYPRTIFMFMHRKQWELETHMYFHI